LEAAERKRKAAEERARRAKQRKEELEAQLRREEKAGCKDVAALLRSIGLDNWIGPFAKEHIDFETLSQLNEQDFKELGLRIGERKRLARKIRDVTKKPPPATTTSSATKTPETTTAVPVYPNAVASAVPAYPHVATSAVPAYPHVAASAVPAYPNAAASAVPAYPVTAPHRAATTYPTTSAHPATVGHPRAAYPAHATMDAAYPVSGSTFLGPNARRAAVSSGQRAVFVRNQKGGGRHMTLQQINQEIYVLRTRQQRRGLHYWGQHRLQNLLNVRRQLSTIHHPPPVHHAVPIHHLVGRHMAGGHDGQYHNHAYHSFS